MVLRVPMVLQVPFDTESTNYLAPKARKNFTPLLKEKQKFFDKNPSIRPAYIDCENFAGGLMDGTYLWTNNRLSKIL